MDQELSLVEYPRVYDSEPLIPIDVYQRNLA